MAGKFRFAPKGAEKIVKWPVTVRVPIDGGRSTEETFTGHFKLLTKSRADELDAGTVYELLSEVLVGWDGVLDEDGADVAFTPDHRDALFEFQHTRDGVLEAYRRAAAGGKSKN